MVRIAAATTCALVLALADADTCASGSEWQTDVIIGNGQISIEKATDVSECCSKCESAALCACWTFKTSDDPYAPLDCMLKSADQCAGSSQKSHRVSGKRAAPTPPPAPPPPGPPSPIKVTGVTAPTGSTPKYGIAEWQVALEGIDEKDWEAVNLTLSLEGPSNGEKSTVLGFNYDGTGDDWRVRFAPSVVGSYSYTLQVTRFEDELHSSTGTVQCSSSNAKGWIRPQYDTFPYRSVYEGDGTLFTGSGLGDCLNADCPTDGSPCTLSFDTVNETDGSVYKRTLDEYARDYSDFSIFRWSDGNCAYDIVDSFDSGQHKEQPAQRLSGNKYHAHLLELTDRFMDTMRDQGIGIWFVPFTTHSKLPPLSTAGDHWTIWHEAQREALGRYLDMVVARWGAKVDVWSLTNEARSPDNWINWAAEYLRNNDPYKHPISVSWNRPDLDVVELNEIHWYHSVNIEDEDTDSGGLITQSLAAEKPVYITETGMLYHNWDKTSHIRMRMRTYVSFFKGAVLMWWNTAGDKNCHPCGGGNMYLGPMERGYQKVYMDFVAPMTDPKTQAFNLTVPEGIRAYGLLGAEQGGDGTVVMVYAHHFADHSSNTTAELVFPDKMLPPLSSCSGDWVHPDTGATSPASPSSSTAVTTPDFAIDVALRLVCGKAEADLMV